MQKEAIIFEWVKRHPAFTDDFTKVISAYKRWEIRPTYNIVKIMLATHGIQLGNSAHRNFSACTARVYCKIQVRNLSCLLMM